MNIFINEVLKRRVQDPGHLAVIWIEEQLVLYYGKRAESNGRRLRVMIRTRNAFAICVCDSSTLTRLYDFYR